MKPAPPVMSALSATLRRAYRPLRQTLERVRDARFSRVEPPRDEQLRPGAAIAALAGVGEREVVPHLDHTRLLGGGLLEGGGGLGGCGGAPCLCDVGRDRERVEPAGRREVAARGQP